MRIGLNAQVITDGRTGVTRVAKNVIQLLPKVGNKHEFIVFGNSSDLSFKENNVKLIKTPDWVNSSSKRILWEQLILPKLINKLKIDVMFYPDHTASLFYSIAKQVIVIHDLAPFIMPETFNRVRSLYKQLAIKNSIRKVKCIITSSNSTKSEIENYFKNVESKINVVHWGIDNNIIKVDTQKSVDELIKKYNLQKPFILFVGTLELRKNILGLIKAYAYGKTKMNWTHSLVLVGSKGYGYDEMYRTIHSEGIQDFVKIIGYVGNDELAGFYTIADIFIYPSLYEGFGFPPLEAMKCGCPVIVSNTTSLPEVVGDAGLYVNPYDVNSMVTQIDTLINNENLKRELVFKGLERSKIFTWEKTVAGILDVLEKI